MTYDTFIAILPNIIIVVCVLALTWIEIFMERTTRTKVTFCVLAAVIVGTTIYSGIDKHEQSQELLGEAKESGRFAYLETNNSDLKAGKGRARLLLYAVGYLSFVKVYVQETGVQDGRKPLNFYFEDRDIKDGLTHLSDKVALPPGSYAIDIQTKGARTLETLRIEPFRDGLIEYQDVIVNGERRWGKIRGFGQKE